MEKQQAVPVLRSFHSVDGISVDVIDYPISKDHRCLLTIKIPDSDTGQEQETTLCRCHAQDVIEVVQQAIAFAEQVDEGLI